MDKYIESSFRNTSKRTPRSQWERHLVELSGRLDPNYRHRLSGIFMRSYSRVETFTHSYHIQRLPCPTHADSLINSGINGMRAVADARGHLTMKKQGISALDFDAKGIYLASVTKQGCLTVHDFEKLYCQSTEQSHSDNEDERNHLLHISTLKQLDCVRWNIANQVEVACSSMKADEVLIFDVRYDSSQPVEVLRRKYTVGVHGFDICKGLCDITFISNEKSRLLGCDMFGTVNLWDRRTGDFPCLELRTGSFFALNSIQMHVDNQLIFGADKQGVVHVWDIRGGRSSASFQSDKETYPLASFKLSSLMEKIEMLKAQSEIVQKEVHSININPSCPYQLAFHLDDGWSGVLNIHNYEVTHIHCPPPAWLNEADICADLSYLRKPSWIQEYSIYVVCSSSDPGIYLLDFFPDLSSPCHVDHVEGLGHTRWTKNRFFPLMGSVTACVAHPLDATIVVGTKNSSLMIISQGGSSWTD